MMDDKNQTDCNESKVSQSNTDDTQTLQQGNPMDEPVTTDSNEKNDQIVANSAGTDVTIVSTNNQNSRSENRTNNNNVGENVTNVSSPSVEQSTTEVENMDTTPVQDQIPQTITSKSSSVHKTSNTRQFSAITYSESEPDLLESIQQNSSNKQLIDRLLGCAYGQALGDAYGLATEFEDRYDVASKYPDTKKRIPFPNYIKTNHNRRWKTGDWTDDTDQWILILDTLVFCDGDVKEFAKKLKGWIENGYRELGDYGGMGIGANVYQVVRSPDFTIDPLRTSENIWERGGRSAAPNGAVMRCSASAFVHFNDRQKVIDTTQQLAKTTHFDPRCISSCLAICLTITYLLTEEKVRDDIEELIKRVQKETIDILGNEFSDEHRKLFLWHTDNRTLEELNLDEPNSIGYTYKCLASGFYGLRSTRSFKDTLHDLIRYGGDADTNGAVCGTMYGARYGYNALPNKWLRQMPYKKWLDTKLIECLRKMNVIDDIQSIETSI